MRALEDRGAVAVLAPTIRIEPLSDLEPLHRALAQLAAYRWTVFTSQNAVQVVCARLPTWGLDPSIFVATRVAAIGPATAKALAARGVRVDLLPRGYVAESLVEALAASGDLRGTRILIPRAESARDALPEGLRAGGSEVDVIPVYRTVAAGGDGAALARELRDGAIDVVTFTSSSTVHQFVTLVGKEAAASPRYAAAVIGPVTAGTAREYGMPVTIEATEFTTAGLVDALVRHFT